MGEEISTSCDPCVLIVTSALQRRERHPADHDVRAIFRIGVFGAAVRFHWAIRALRLTGAIDDGTAWCVGTQVFERAPLLPAVPFLRQRYSSACRPVKSLAFRAAMVGRNVVQLGMIRTTALPALRCPIIAAAPSPRLPSLVPRRDFSREFSQHWPAAPSSLNASGLIVLFAVRLTRRSGLQKADAQR